MAPDRRSAKNITQGTDQKDGTCCHDWGSGCPGTLERGGWIVRERDPSDRRAVVVRVVRDRFGELLGLYAGMGRAMNKLLAGYSDRELEVIADFMRKTLEAGRAATEDFGAEQSSH